MLGEVLAAAEAVAAALALGALGPEQKADGCRHAEPEQGHDAAEAGVPVTNFYRSNRLYYLNRRLDPDKDGIACEKH